MNARAGLLLMLLELIGGVAVSQRAMADEIAVAGGNMSVNADARWQKLSAGASHTRWEEVWTWSGPQVDRVTLIGGVPDGKAIVSQYKTADKQVPAFRADMTAYDLASMIEVSYRVNGVTVFMFESVEPVDFLGGAGVRMRYRYASGLGIMKTASCVMRIVDRKLYAMKMESVANRHSEDVAAGFERLVASARLRQ